METVLDDTQQPEEHKKTVEIMVSTMGASVSEQDWHHAEQEFD
jgi:nitrous oxide reductase accessory protein NosL